jgi:hypothetical protein
MEEKGAWLMLNPNIELDSAGNRSRIKSVSRWTGTKLLSRPCWRFLAKTTRTVSCTEGWVCTVGKPIVG